MKPKHPLSFSIVLSRSGVAVACLAIIGCATPSGQSGAPKLAIAERSLNQARSTALPTEQRIAYYLQAMADSAPLPGSGDKAVRSRRTYDDAAAEITVLLCTADGGRWWNKPESVSTGAVVYRLRFAPAVRDKVWPPDYFQLFAPASKIKESALRKRIIRDGVGGDLVGVRHPAQRDPFMGPKGIITAPVTATVEFSGKDALLTLQDPRIQTTVRIAGSVQPLAADMSAPFVYYKPGSNLWIGLMAGFRAAHYMNRTGLFFVQPYDPNRIPVIFVHGLISTPAMWLRVANQLYADPEVRARYQFWVFGYPSGNPMAYSALRFRQDLADLEKTYPQHRPLVLVGHSLGGLVSQMQVTTITSADWARTAGKPTAELLDRVPPDSLIRRALIFDSNRHIQRVVFICTPHRGSNLAINSIGQLAMSLIVLPSNLVGLVHDQIGSALTTFTGSAKRLPNSVFSLSPKNPTLLVMDKVPISCPYHSIIGDRGKGDTPNSSDGVVPYWSSHMDGAQSELIVPGPHGSCELPQTIAELDRILLLNLGTSKP